LQQQQGSPSPASAIPRFEPRGPVPAIRAHEAGAQPPSSIRFRSHARPPDRRSTPNPCPTTSGLSPRAGLARSSPRSKPAICNLGITSPSDAPVAVRESNHPDRRFEMSQPNIPRRISPTAFRALPSRPPHSAEMAGIQQRRQRPVSLVRACRRTAKATTESVILHHPVRSPLQRQRPAGPSGLGLGPAPGRVRRGRGLHAAEDPSVSSSCPPAPVIRLDSVAAPRRPHSGYGDAPPSVQAAMSRAPRSTYRSAVHPSDRAGPPTHWYGAPFPCGRSWPSRRS